MEMDSFFGHRRRFASCGFLPFIGQSIIDGWSKKKVLVFNIVEGKKLNSVEFLGRSLHERGKEVILVEEPGMEKTSRESHKTN